MDSSYRIYYLLWPSGHTYHFKLFTLPPAFYVKISIYDEDVATGKTQHLGTVATLSEVECHGSLGVGSVRGSDGESESGSKGTANIDGVVRAGND